MSKLAARGVEGVRLIEYARTAAQRTGWYVGQIYYICAKARRVIWDRNTIVGLRTHANRNGGNCSLC
jgi:hypothetical protein